MASLLASVRCFLPVPYTYPTRHSGNILKFSPHEHISKFSADQKPVEGYSWVYHPTERSCNMDIEAVAKERAIKHFLRTTEPTSENQLCSTQCFDLTDSAHGAFWNGFLLAGPTDDFNASMYCGPTIDLS